MAHETAYAVGDVEVVEIGVGGLCAGDIGRILDETACGSDGADNDPGQNQPFGFGNVPDGRIHYQQHQVDYHLANGGDAEAGIGREGQRHKGPGQK